MCGPWRLPESRRATSAASEYASNVTALHAAPPADIPGKPPLATVVSLDTLGPKRLRLRTSVSLSENASGELEAAFVAARRHWWNRAPRNVSVLEIEWDRQAAPEGVCRIRDRQNKRQDGVILDG